MMNSIEAVAFIVEVLPVQAETDTPHRKSPAVIRRQRIGVYGYPSGFE